MRAAGVVALLAAVAALGCGQSTSVEQQIAQCAKLPGASASDHPRLRELLTVVRTTGGTPAQLAPQQLGESADPLSNAATALADCWSDPLRWRLSPAIDDLIENRHAVFRRSSPERAEAKAIAIAGFLKRNGKLREKLTAASQRPRCVFDAGFTWGFFAGLRFVDDAGLATRISLLEAVDAAREQDALAAWQGLDRALRWSGWLSRVQRVEPRVLAATLRAETLSSAEALFGAGAIGKPAAESLYSRLRDTLNNWPSDNAMLVGDRAVTLHTYETLRLGLLDRVLTARERNALPNSRLIKLQQATPADIDQDQVNYLGAIALLLDGDNPSAGPSREAAFYERLDRFDKALAIADEPPGLFAGPLFINDLIDALRLTARDRARCEVWCIALASAGEMTMPPYRTNPATDLDYTVDRRGERVVVKAGDPAIADISLPVW